MRRRIRLTPVLALIGAVALAASPPIDLSGDGDAQPIAAPQADDAPIDQAYRPGYWAGGARTPSTPVAYEGDPVRVQAVEIGRPALEPTIGIDADGNAVMTAAFHDGKTIVLPRTFVYRSTDGGLTWEDVTSRIPVEGDANPPVNADPFILTDQDTGRIFQPELASGCMYMNISDDVGDSWLTHPLACGNVPVDHHSVEVGPFPPLLEPLKTSYPNVVYHCSNRVADVVCGRSLDGGITWNPGVEPAFHSYHPELGLCAGGLHGHLDTDSEGRLFLPKGHCSEPVIAISDDGATTWTRVRVLEQLGGAGAHLSVAVDDADNVWFLWWDPEQRLPWLSYSQDHGLTWSEPMMVAPPGVAEVNWPVLEAGAEGRVAIAFPGTTVANRDDQSRPWHAYQVVGLDLLGDEPLFVSTTANVAGDPVHRGNCGPGRCGPLWDFQDIQISPLDGGFWAAIADSCRTQRCLGGKRPVRDDVTTGMGVAVRQIGGPRVRDVVLPDPSPAPSPEEPTEPEPEPSPSEASA